MVLTTKSFEQLDGIGLKHKRSKHQLKPACDASEAGGRAGCLSGPKLHAKSDP